MRVLHVCSELYPLLKTGGLADVLGALPFAQKEIGIDTRILLPAYPKISAGLRIRMLSQNLIILLVMLYCVMANTMAWGFI